VLTASTKTRAHIANGGIRKRATLRLYYVIIGPRTEISKPLIYPNRWTAQQFSLLFTTLADFSTFFPGNLNGPFEPLPLPTETESPVQSSLE
jgi:hypothetical protein